MRKIIKKTTPRDFAIILKPGCSRFTAAIDLFDGAPADLVDRHLEYLVRVVVAKVCSYCGLT